MYICVYICVYTWYVYIGVVLYFQWRWTLLNKFSSFWNYFSTELCLGLIPWTYTEGGFQNSLPNLITGFPRWWSREDSTCQWRRHRRGRFNPWWGRSLRVGNGNFLQYSCLENSMDRGAWRAIVHGFTKSWTWLRDLARTHIYIYI